MILSSCHQRTTNIADTAPAEQEDQFTPHWAEHLTNEQLITNHCSKMLLTEEAKADIKQEIKKRKLHPYCDK